MIAHIIKFLKSIRSVPLLHSKLDELMWADIYRETIKDKPWLLNLPISPGDMAANFSLLYLLTRIFSEYKIYAVLEFGLGQSSRFIESYTLNVSKSLHHDVVEDNSDWVKFFDGERDNKYNIIIPQKTMIKRHNSDVQIYLKLNQLIRDEYDLYLIDGPRGLPKYSRYDICEIALSFNDQSQFIIIIDDYNRIGEKETATELIKILKNKSINIFTKTFAGSKTQLLIVTEKYKFATSF